MTSLGPTELFVLLVVLPLLVLPIWAIVDALIRPDSQWAATDQAKTVWLVVLILGTLALGIIGVVLSIVYLVSVRPKLKRAG